MGDRTGDRRQYDQLTYGPTNMLRTNRLAQYGQGRTGERTGDRTRQETGQSRRQDRTGVRTGQSRRQDWTGDTTGDRTGGGGDPEARSVAI